MKARLGMLVLVALLLGAGRSVSASEWWPVEVLQPIATENGLALSRVTYGGYLAGVSAVDFTCAPNRIPDLVLLRIGYRFADSTTRDLNAASLAGLKAKADTSTWPDIGDTLRAELDVSSLSAKGSPYSWPDTSLVTATAQCVLFNAAEWRQVRFIALKIVGPKVYARFGGVFPAERYRCGPTQRQY